MRDATVWSIPDRVVNFVHVIGKTEFEHRSLDNVVAFDANSYAVIPYLGGLPKSSSEFSQSWSVFNIWLTI